MARCLWPCPAACRAKACANAPTKIVAEIGPTAVIYFCISRSGWE